MVTQISDWNDLDTAIQGTNGSGETGDFELVSNLDKDTAGYAGIGDDWTPCGNNVNGDGFRGTFDGKGHVIRDLVIKDSGVTGNGGIGLIGSTETTNSTSATIKNLGVVGEITTTNLILFGGMIVGNWIDGVKISSCWAAGTIDVGDAGDVGGIVGQGGEPIEDCYSFVDITAGDSVGGFAGDLSGDTTSRCYAAGAVTGNNEVGGFTGDSRNGATQPDCFWDTEATGQSTSAGGATGLTTSEMQGSSASSNLTGFDFTNDWKTVVGGSNSDVDGYPYLRGLSVHAQSSVQTARFNPFSITVTGSNSPVNADGELTLDVDITNDGSFEGEADLELIVEEA